MIFVLIVIFAIWWCISEVAQMWREAHQTPEQVQRQAEAEAERVYPHYVPFASEWGVASYRQCYCDGSVCGSFPKGGQPRHSQTKPPVKSTLTTPQGGELTPQNIIQTVEDEIEEGRLWLPKRDSLFPPR